MNDNAKRRELEDTITQLTRALDEAATEGERQEILRQISALEGMVRDINIMSSEELGGRIDNILGELNKVIDLNSLDAASALGRAVKELRKSSGTSPPD